MRLFGFLLIVVGITMILVKGFSVRSEKKVVDLGKVEINQKENHWIGWPTYTGAFVAACGVVIALASSKKKEV